MPDDIDQVADGGHRAGPEQAGHHAMGVVARRAERGGNSQYERVERRVLEQPSQLARASCDDGGRARIHHRERSLVGDETVADPPFDRARPESEPDRQIVARVNHLVTIP